MADTEDLKSRYEALYVIGLGGIAELIQSHNKLLCSPIPSHLNRWSLQYLLQVSQSR